MPIRVLPLALAALPFVTSMAAAQGLPVGATVANASLTAYTQLDADIDGGGEAKFSGAFALGSVTRRFSQAVTAGVSLRYDYEKWDWSGANDLGGEPWNRLHRPGLGATFVYATPDGLAFTVLPAIEWAYESGASTGDALNWGAAFAVSKRFSPDLMLGVGAGVYREIDDDVVIPVLLVDWRISDRLRVGNPAQTGPAGGAGLELVWTPGDRWEFAAGGVWRSYRFRLDRDGPVPDGIGEKSSLPLLARATWRPTPSTRLDFYAGAAVAGEITLHDRDNNEIVSRDMDPAALFGVTFGARF